MHNEVTIENGPQKQTFNIAADNYDANRHFFLAHYFRNRYNEFNRNYSLKSNIVITRIEVWVSNANNSLQNSRNAITFMDLRENSDIFNKKDFQMNSRKSLPENMRMLNTNEFSCNSALGY